MDSNPADLELLQKLLRTPGLPKQKVIAASARVDQGLVSRARNGGLKRITPRVRRLFDKVGEQVASLSALSDAVSAEALSAPINPRLAEEREVVLQQIDRYLADGLDGQLLIQQLAVLRRAQGKRAGRPPKRI